MDSMHRSVVVGLSTVGMLEANLTLNPIGPEALTCVVAAGLLVVGASHCAYRLQGGDSKLVPSSISIWRKQWQPSPVLLPGKSHGQRSLVGCNPWGC